MTARVKEKTYPNHTLEDKLLERGVRFKCLWEMRGPKDSGIDWIVSYLVEARVIIVHTFKGRRGWEVYLASQEGETDATVDEVIAHCTLKQQEENT